MKIALSSIFRALPLAVFGISSAAAATQPALIPRNIVPALASRTAVPVLMPHKIPGYAKVPHTQLLHAGPRDYYVDFAWTAECTEQNACAIGTVRGQSTPIRGFSEARPEPVRLDNGDRGYYYASHCIMYCTPAYVTWKHHGYYYLVALKAESKAHIMTMANSTR